MEFEISAETLSSVIENIIGGVCVFAVTEGNGIFPVYLNEGFYRMLGYTHKEMDRVFKNIRQSIIPDDLPIFEQGLNDIMKDDGSVEFEFRTVTMAGDVRWLQVRGNLYGKLEGYPLIAGVILDSTTRKTVEEELALQAERLNILSNSVKEHLIDYNPRTDVMNIRLNSSALSKGEIIIKDFIGGYDFAHIDADTLHFIKEIMIAASKTPMSDSLEFKTDFFEPELSGLHWYRANITSVKGSDGYVSRIVGRVVNIDEEKQKEEQLKIKADVDSLTGLYNKGAATTLISEAIEKSRESGQLCAMMMIDLDNFKSINDTFGHAVGDSVITEAGTKLKDTFKGRDIVGRMGGDEFMVYMQDIKNSDDALGIAKKLNSLIKKTYSDSVSDVTVTASIGIAMFSGEEKDFTELYQKADKALYNTKENGKNGRTLYSPDKMQVIPYV